MMTIFSTVNYITDIFLNILMYQNQNLTIQFSSYKLPANFYNIIINDTMNINYGLNIIINKNYVMSKNLK